MVQISNILGTPSPKNWQGIDLLPDYGKIIFKEQEPRDLKEVVMEKCNIILQESDSSTLNTLIDILYSMLQYSPEQRKSCS